MACLEIRHRTGMIETRELSKQSPVLVGTLASNDVRVDADGVAPIHCRISWNRAGFEVAAVTADGVQLNGRSVRQSPLAPGDVIRVGDVDIVMQTEIGHEQPHVPEFGAVAAEEPPAAALPSVSHIELRAISDSSLPVRSFHVGQTFAQDVAAAPGSGAAAPAAHTPQSDPVPAPPERATPARRVTDVIFEVDELQRSTASDEELEREGQFISRTGRPERRPKAVLALPRVRPGERDPLRSPLVIGLSLGSLALLLAAGTIWFVLSREAAQRQFDLAESQLQTGQFAQAIESFTLFLKQYPRHKLAPQARVEIGTARVEQVIGGASPAWDKGLEALQAYIDEQRETEAFQKPESPLRQFVLQTADRIAMGALETARTLHKRPLLGVSAEAVKLIELYTPADSRPESRLAELAKAAQGAEAAIVQQEAVDDSVRQIDAALDEKQAGPALREYRRIVGRYGESARGDRVLRDRLKKLLDLERQLTVREESPREPIREPSPPATELPQLTLANRTRARSDISSVGATVSVLAEDCAYGVDSATGDALWRRVIGLDPPFAPIAVRAGQPALLLYDGRRKELLLVRERTGESIWRLPLSAQPLGAPLLYEGQIYLATEDGRLEQIDLQSGTSSARLLFSQKIVGPAAVSQSGDKLYVPGRENLLYVLTRRPLGCEQAVWLGHGPGAVEVPPLMLRSYLLLAENDRQQSALLRLFDVGREGQPPVEIATHRLEGRVRDLPLLRGKDLFVPSTPERISALTVAEAGDKASLTFRASYQVKDAVDTPIFISAGPDDQVWMESTALRRFEMTRDALLPAKQELAPGLAAQPLQSSGDTLYLARRQPYSRAVLLAEADRRQMSVQWQLAVGAAVIASASPQGQSAAVLCVTTLGDLFQVSPQRVARGGFELQPSGHLSAPEKLVESFEATRLSDGRLAVYCGGPEPRLWLPGGDGLPREIKLEQSLQAAPVRMAGGILLPLPGRLRLFGRPGNERIEDLPAPVGQEGPPRWLSLAGLGDDRAVVLSEQGRVVRIQFGTAPIPHLEEITHWDAGSPVDLPLLLSGNRLFLVDSTSRLVMLDANSLEPLAQAALAASPAARPRVAGDQAYVELKTGKLASYSVSGRLGPLWELALEGGSLTDDPLINGGLVLFALTDGRVLWVEPATGQVTRTLDLGQQLAYGPVQWGDQIVVGTLDGTLIPVANGE